MKKEGQKKNNPKDEDMVLEIRHAGIEDLPQILILYEQARSLMAANGNATQWNNGYPEKRILENDIQKNQLYVGIKNGKIVLVFMFLIGPEPTYEVIEGGSWLRECPYGTIHRLASPGLIAHGGDQVINWCYEQCCQARVDLRGDTHKNNLPMQHIFEKNGFIQCGTIYVYDGSPRIAYQKIFREKE